MIAAVRWAKGTCGLDMSRPRHRGPAVIRYPEDLAREARCEVILRWSGRPSAQCGFFASGVLRFHERVDGKGPLSTETDTGGRCSSRGADSIDAMSRR